MGMVVRCNSCMTEYRLNEALLKGAKGACIRCPKCRERIFIENPQAAPAAPSILHRGTPPVATTSIPPRVEPPAAPPIPQRVPPPSATPIVHRVPPLIGSPVPSSPAPPWASRTVQRLTPPAVRQIAQPVAHSPIIPPPIASPRMPRVEPPVAVESGTPLIRDAAPQEMTTPVPRDSRVEGADLSDRILPEPVVGVDDGIVVSPTPDTASDPPEFPRRNVLRLEELFIHPSAVEERRVPGGGEEDPRKIRPSGRKWNSSTRRPRYRRPLFLVASIAVFLLAGGAFYFVDGDYSLISSGDVLFARERSAPDHPVFDVGNLKGYLGKQASGDPLYVVKGTVRNIGKDLSSAIRVEATLLGKGNQPIVKGETFAGNVIDEKLISHMTRVRIEAFLDMRYGEGNVNRDIPTGKTLPFMVVFFDPPEGIESFVVKAMNSEESRTIQPRDAKGRGARDSSRQTIGWN